MRMFEKLEDLAPLVGQEIGVSDWIAVDQPRIQAFADATEDQQWIHTDPARAAAGPFGTTIAHGFLTLSLLPRFYETAFRVREVRMGINYGLDRVRFPAPVPVDSRLRGRFVLKRLELIEGGVQMMVEVTVEREAGGKPVCIAESLTRQHR
ncbi:MaoC family dehydratase [Mitsuaria sp. TWR114]|uniref:MaoC family dehydratase n=1 Tax=Mitsuaria sp. TWR114 TaxID=2601731 RepID=UPI0011BF163A|nr:MaoC family dehydratase [Mitsuaria sp. TWR114]TXE00499.1 MaoC family dehydratase [Mitsuaria sp. TWR114]